MYFCIKGSNGTQVKLVSCKSALNPKWFILLTVLRRWPRVSLTLYCFVVYSMRRFVLSYAWCHFVFSFLFHCVVSFFFFSSLSIVITSFWEERANLSAFCMLV